MIMRQGAGFITCCGLVIVAAMSVELAMGCELTFKWEVTNITRSPDGVIGSVLAINGTFPGPTINAKTGDNIVVYLTNKLQNDGLSIHWHGIRQIGTPWADGAANITQCPIQPGHTFKYNFTVDKAGTYFYHGHYKMQRSAGLYGMLIVDDETEKGKISKYDGEFNLLFSDWWHESIHQQELDLSLQPMKWIGEAQSLLINGRGQNCYLAARANKTSAKPVCKLIGNEENAPQILHVQSNKTYRVRLASTTSLASLSFAIENHLLEVIEADGNLVDPFIVPSLYIYPGQTYSFLLHTKPTTANASYWVSIDVIGRKPNTTQGLTVLAYDHPNFILPTSPPPHAPQWDDYTSMKSFARKISALIGSPKPPTKPTKTIYLLNTQNIIDGRTKWSLNNHSLLLPATPFLASIAHNLTGAYDVTPPPTTFDMTYDITKPPVYRGAINGSTVYKLEPNVKVVDVILQNANALNANVSEIHPWHLHGHDFWVLGYGEGRFKDKKGLNSKNPPLRQTEVIFPYGWTALRFMADNPGVWAFHCHIEPHMEMGMGVVFAYGVDRIAKVLPDDGLVCGLYKGKGKG